MPDGTPRHVIQGADSQQSAIAFRPTLDSHSLEIQVNGVSIGSIQWLGEDVRVGFSTPNSQLMLPLATLEAIVDRANAVRIKSWLGKANQEKSPAHKNRP